MAYKATTDRPLFITVSLLTLFGLVMVYSASSVVASAKHGMSSYYFLRQLAYAGAGYLMMLVLMNLDYRVWQKDRIVRLMLAVGSVALLFVLLQPRINGAHRWFRYGPISIQPSEFAKLVLLVFLAWYLSRHESEINDPKRRLAPCLLVIGIYAGLIAVEPDLGQAICFTLIALLLLFIAGLRWKFIGLIGLVSVPLVCVAIMQVSFRWERLRAFLDPFHDPLGSGWQISQSLTAVGSGGLFGLGLGASKQKLFFLPEAHSDFIFAVIGEELGLIGTCVAALAFVVFLQRGVRAAFRAPDRFGFYLAMGITFMVVLQAFINISMVLALMPTKGIALPFMSQGGSSLLLNLISAGILLNISHYGESA